MSKRSQVANSQASVAKNFTEPTCDFITPASPLSRFPHFNTWETPICVSDASAAAGFCWHVVLFSEKNIYLSFFLFNILRASSIGVDVCQRRHFFAVNKTDVGGWDMGSWLVGWLAGWENHLWHRDGWLYFLQQQQLYVWQRIASASGTVCTITSIASEPEQTGGVEGGISPLVTTEQKAKKRVE